MVASIGEYDSEPVDQFRTKLLLEMWTVRAHKAARSHYIQAATHKDRNRNLTLANALFAIAVLFFTNTNWVKDFIVNCVKKISGESSGELGVGIFYGFTSILALLVVLTTILQFIVRWGERSERHRFAGAEFSNLQRKCERYALVEKLNMAMVHNLNRDYNHITKSYPLVNSEIWRRAGDGDLNLKVESLEAAFRNTTTG